MNLRHHLLRTTTAITAAGALLAIGLTGATSAAAVPTSVLVPTPTELVTKVLLINGDLATGYATRLVPGGRKVRGEVTLTNCGYRFTTEKYRVARRQVVVMKGTTSVGLSNEVVAYDTGAHAALALAQLRRSVRGCTVGMYITSEVKGVPDIRYDVSRVTSGLTHLPVADNAVVSLKEKPRGTAKPFFQVIVAQRAGRVLNLMYLGTRTAPADAALNTVGALAVVTGQRLAAE